MLDKYTHEIALGKIQSVGPVLAKLLISYCGSAEQVFSQKKSQLLKIPQIGEKTARNILAANPEQLAQTELSFIIKNDIQVISYLDDNYPQRLSQYEQSPLLLFMKGQVDLNASRHVAIIGTRKPTEYGKAQVSKLVNELINYKPTIISGLAYGIDTSAHRAAVKADLTTIGILGHGLDRVYPAQNKRLAQEMLNNGSLLTEFPSGTNPDAVNFPMRNRIIAALSDLVVVVESGIKGGSVITAEFANAYHKDVFAFPGKITDKASAGCNALIKQHKASLIESAKDIAYIMRWEESNLTSPIQPKLFLELTDKEQCVYDFLVDKSETSFDAIHLDLPFAIGQLSSLLLDMEFKGVLRSLPGKRYSLI